MLEQPKTKRTKRIEMMVDSVAESHGLTVCSIAGCATRARYHGLCAKHENSERLRKIANGEMQKCSINGCPYECKKEGLCTKHFRASRATK